MCKQYRHVFLLLPVVYLVLLGGPLTARAQDGLSSAQWITSFYLAYWNRNPDAAGHAYWLGMFTRGELTIPEIAENFALSAEARAAYPYFNAPETATNAQRGDFVRAVYSNLLDREAGADDPGVLYWVGELRSGRTTPGAVIGNIIYAALQAGGADWQTIWDKVQNAGPEPPQPGARLQPRNFTYSGAFRLPDSFHWGARGLAYNPNGAGGAGTLLATGFELPMSPDHPGESCWDPSWSCNVSYGELAIPTPGRHSTWEDLPEAALLGGMINFDQGLVTTLHREYLFVSDLEYVPRRGSQVSDKIYGALELWYAEGVMGEESFPTIWFSNPGGGGVRGLFHVGPRTAPYHGRKMGAYLFSVPQWYADQYLGGRTLMTGRSRGTPATGFEPITIHGGSQGPTLFALHPFSSDDPSGDLDALPVLYYRVKFPGCAGPNVGDPAACDYPHYTMCDDWSGGAFVEGAGSRAILLLGFKGLGGDCYDEPPVVCHDPCGDAHGYHCHPYERQVVFYDVEELGQSASGGRAPWTVLPYAVWRPEGFFLQGHTCWNVGGMAFDREGGRLFMVERGLAGETNAAVVHVWQVR